MINNGFLFHCRTQNQLVDPRDWTVDQQDRVVSLFNSVGVSGF